LPIFRAELDEFLPEFIYDRAALNSREGRRELTQQMMRAFEPVIREHLDQWYHFVPIWPEGVQPDVSERRT
jgi:lauroyl/myristoyl acyltransferase